MSKSCNYSAIPNDCIVRLSWGSYSVDDNDGKCKETSMHCNLLSNLDEQWVNVKSSALPKTKISVKGILQDLLARSALNFIKQSYFDMIAKTIGILIYHVKSSAERGQVFSKYRFYEYFWDPKLINLIHNYWYFAVRHVTVWLQYNAVRTVNGSWV